MANSERNKLNFPHLSILNTQTPKGSATHPQATGASRKQVLRIKRNVKCACDYYWQLATIKEVKTDNKTTYSKAKKLKLTLITRLILYNIRELVFIYQTLFLASFGSFDKNWREENKNINILNFSRKIKKSINV